MTMLRALPLFLTVPLLGGCLSTVGDIVTLPVKVAKTGVNAVGSGVDAVTTSQSERDEKRGRDLRRREERLGQLSRQRDKLRPKCERNPGGDACEDMDDVQREIDSIMNQPV